jgi:hypothetical protein
MKQGETFEFTQADTIDAKGVRSLALLPERGDVTPRSFLQLQVTVEKTVQCDEDPESGPSSAQNSPAFEEKSRLGLMTMTGTVG